MMKMVEQIPVHMATRRSTKDRTRATPEEMMVTKEESTVTAHQVTVPVMSMHIEAIPAGGKKEMSAAVRITAIAAPVCRVKTMSGTKGIAITAIKTAGAVKIGKSTIHGLILGVTGISHAIPG
jgi:hypothetical protein